MNKEILFVTLHMTDGGAERVASELISQWVRSGCKVIIIQLMPEMFENSYDMPDDLRYINFDLGTNHYLKLFRGVKQLLGVMKDHPQATVIGFVKETIYVAGIASLFAGNRIVLSERNDPYTTPASKFRKMLRNWCFRRADACVFQTPDARDYFCPGIRQKGVVIPNPVDPTLPVRYEGDREKKIVAAGRLRLQKNFAMLIKAFARLTGDFPQYELVIYGRGSLENDLKTLARSLGVGDKVKFPGFSDNIHEDMLRCSVYVSSSDYEGISNSMLEAMAMGIPSVVTDCPIGGARMVIRDGVNGLLVPVGDEKAMAEAIGRVLADKDLADRIGREACRIREEYPIEKIADRWLEVI